MILQLNPIIPMKTPKGSGLCHFMIDYGEEHDLMWVVADDLTGEIWTWPNPKVRFMKNITFTAPRRGNPNDAGAFHAGDSGILNCGDSEA